MKYIESTDIPKFADELKRFYSIHTFTLKQRLTRKECNIIRDHLFLDMGKKYNIRKCFKDPTTSCFETVLVFLVKERWGFNYIKIIECEYEEGKFTYWMEIKINPWSMFHRDEHPFVYIATMEDIECALEAVDNFFFDVGLNWIHLGQFYLSRADYCVNIDLGDIERADAYMRLMRKGAYPCHSERLPEYSKSGKRMIDTKNSFTVQTKSWEFSVYNKYRQMDEGGR